MNPYEKGLPLGDYGRVEVLELAAKRRNSVALKMDKNKCFANIRPHCGYVRFLNTYESLSAACISVQGQMRICN